VKYRGRRFDHRHYLKESAMHFRVARSEFMHSVEVPINQFGTQGHAANRRVPEVFAGGYHPGGVNRFVRHPAETVCHRGRVLAPFPLPFEAFTQDGDGHCGGGHALAVNRIETAQGVAQDDQALRKSIEIFVVSAQVGWELMGYDGAERLRVFDRSVEGGSRQVTSKFKVTLLIIRRMIANPAGKCRHPSVLFNRKDYPQPRLGGWRGINQQNSPFLIRAGRTPIKPGSVTDIDVDDPLERLWVSEFLQPLRSPRPAAARINHQIRLQFFISTLPISSAYRIVEPDVYASDSGPAGVCKESKNLALID
jgi:hypothetical protein